MVTGRRCGIGALGILLMLGGCGSSSSGSLADAATDVIDDALVAGDAPRAAEGGLLDGATDGPADAEPLSDAAIVPSDAAPLPDATADADDVSASVPTAVPGSLGSAAVVDGTHPADEAILAWLSNVSTAPSFDTAASHRRAHEEARDALRAGGAATADRVREAYAAMPSFDAVTRAVALRMLGEVESAESLALLVREATNTPPRGDGTHVTVAPTQGILQLAAMEALVARVLDGSTDAKAALLGLLGHSDERVRELAVIHVFLAVPRREARRESFARLPSNERWRVYQVRP